MVSPAFPNKGATVAFAFTSKIEAPLVAASGAILFPSTAIQGVVRYDDGLRRHWA